MDKKDIYEHLAQIYLDSSVKKQPKARAFAPTIFRNLFVVSAICIVSLIGTLIFTVSRRKSPYNSEVALVLAPDVLKINFDFNPAKKELYTLSLNKLDLTRFHRLAFSIKKGRQNDTISLRIELINNFKEKAAIYTKEITSRWQNQVIDLAEFKEISDWSEMSKLAFVVEEWNTTEKQGTIYIDNVRVLH